MKTQLKNNLSKAELANLYGLAPSTLRKFLNVHFFKDLKAVGYNKRMQTLTPKIVRKFIELYGEPLNMEY